MKLKRPEPCTCDLCAAFRASKGWTQPDKSASSQAERDSLTRQIETYAEIQRDLVQRNNEHWQIRTAQAAALAACRELLAELVANPCPFVGCEQSETAIAAARDWLAAPDGATLRTMLLAYEYWRGMRQSMGQPQPRQNAERNVDEYLADLYARAAGTAEA